MFKPCLNHKNKKALQSLERLINARDPGAIRTRDLLLRRQLLYPAELRNQKTVNKKRFTIRKS